MKYFQIRATAEGRYSGAIFDESVILDGYTYSRVKDEILDIKLSISDLDGKHSHVFADIEIIELSEDVLIDSNTNAHSNGMLEDEIRDLLDSYPGIDVDEVITDGYEVFEQMAEKSFLRHLTIVDNVKILEVFDYCYDTDKIIINPIWEKAIIQAFQKNIKP